MSDKPILFSVPMIQALLDGRKTQTRRVLKLQPPQGAHSPFTWGTGPKPGYIVFQEMAGAPMHPWPYAPGDRLWVREEWRSSRHYDDLAPSEMSGEEPIKYIADGAVHAYAGHVDDLGGRTRASMHMPRWASRLTLIVTDVRVQRVQEVTRGDAIDEGSPFANMADGPDPRDWFADLWDSLNAKPRPRYGKDRRISHYESFPWGGESRTETYRGKPHYITANPWVSATTFTVHKCNIDQMEGA